MKYYLLREDVQFPERWYLGDIKHCNNWLFIDPPSEYMEPCTYALEVLEEGVSLDFSLAGYASVPILSEKARDALVGIPDVDEPYMNVVLEPVTVAGEHAHDRHYVMIVETQLDCVDESRSAFKKYEVNDPVRPDRAGEYSVFLSLVIDPARVQGKHIFRVKKHSGALIVSEEVKLRLERADLSGMLFEGVNGEGEVIC
ncbi:MULTISPECIES: imm11 family protein [Pseudomonas]|uniref:imm11 family protein n=1 Tax=Pseudomonas TaxID=286 RepID=UPI000C227E9E|nr:MULTISPECIES: DUF1629 domain-containing protein [Pseudomonas]PJH85775.1 hypothetical protein CVG87_28400 [Pseudomonas sp. WCS365]UII13833.1 hypothetical protein LRP86_00697 [Pseudomonas brassicacearum]